MEKNKDNYLKRRISIHLRDVYLIDKFYAQMGKRKIPKPHNRFDDLSRIRIVVRKKLSTLVYVNGILSVELPQDYMEEKQIMLKIEGHLKEKNINKKKTRVTFVSV